MEFKNCLKGISHWAWVIDGLVNHQVKGFMKFLSQKIKAGLLEDGFCDIRCRGIYYS